MSTGARSVAARNLGRTAFVNGARYYSARQQREEEAKKRKTGKIIAGVAILGAVYLVTPPNLRSKFFTKKEKNIETEVESKVADSDPEPAVIETEQKEEETQPDSQESKPEADGEQSEDKAEEVKSDEGDNVLSSDYEEISSDEQNQNQSDDDILSSDFEEVMDSVSESDKENLQLSDEKGEGKKAESMPLNDEKDMGAVEEEVKQESAYNPDTGEINWDCPCLGGMAHGPCGEEFKEAFACFVYSEAEPKGIDCVEKFQHMQDCFRKYPEHYAEQLADPNEEENSENIAAQKKDAKTEGESKDKKAKPGSENSEVSSETPSEMKESKTNPDAQESKEN